ncbi:MAG: serine hydrolase [Patescibacteria group bacterium]
MNLRWQALALIALILISVTLTKTGEKISPTTQKVEANISSAESGSIRTGANISFEKNQSVESNAPLLPKRKWEILDPTIKSEAIIFSSLENGFSFFSTNPEKQWRTASLAKLLTAVIVTEEIGLNKKIPVSRTAITTDGEAGGLKSGEVYTARDMLKIMLLTSSNDAAAAFEEYIGGRSYFVKLMNDKAATIGLTKSIFYDAAGYDDNNVSTAADLLKLTKYILENDPDIFNWTRLQSFIVQPTNDAENRTILNIDPLASNSGFLGGKTGTSPLAKENLIALFAGEKSREIIIILGSADRVKDAETLLKWGEIAYEKQ